jgi:hypothetical protein
MDFIEAIAKIGIYQKKEGTMTSFYFQEGEKILPNRLSVSGDCDFAPVSHSGRMNNRNAKGQIKGTFTKGERSSLKQFSPFNVSSELFVEQSYPDLLYAGIAVSQENGKIKKGKEEGIAVIEYITTDEIRVYFFAGMDANSPDVKDALCYVNKKRRDE